MPTLQEIYEAKRLGRAIIIPQDIVPVTGIVRTMEFQPASHGAFDVVDVAETLPEGSFRRINGGINVATMAKNGVKIDLFPFGSIYEVDAAIIEDYPGGLQGYVKDKTSMFAPGLAKSFESKLVYGDTEGFSGLRQIAAQNSKAVPVNGSGTGNDYTSIIAVKWDPALCTGLYNKSEFKEGLFVPKILNGGKIVYVDEFDSSGSATGKKKPVYQWGIEQKFGIRVIGATQVAALVGIKDADNYRPTETQMDTMLDSINADSSTTKIYLIRGSRTLLKLIKTGKLSYNNADINLSKSPTMYDDIPLITTTGITATEARTA